MTSVGIPATVRVLTVLEQLLEELEPLIEEDDGTVFQMYHIELIEELQELLEELRYG